MRVLDCEEIFGSIYARPMRGAARCSLHFHTLFTPTIVSFACIRAWAWISPWFINFHFRFSIFFRQNMVNFNNFFFTQNCPMICLRVCHTTTLTKRAALLLREPNKSISEKIRSPSPWSSSVSPLMSIFSPCILHFVVVRVCLYSYDFQFRECVRVRKNGNHEMLRAHRSDRDWGNFRRKFVVELWAEACRVFQSQRTSICVYIRKYEWNGLNLKIFRENEWSTSTLTV